MGMTPEQASDRLRQAIEKASESTVTDAGRRWLDDWCLGLGRGGEPRPDIFAADEDDVEITKLSARICEPGEDGLNAVQRVCKRRCISQVNVWALRDLEEAMTGLTKLCDGILAGEVA